MDTTVEMTFAGKTVSQWRAEAQDCRNRSAESFERCDTDGFLSQWASDEMARRYDRCADVALAGGRVEVSAIFDLDGNLVSCDYRKGEFGWYYLVPDAKRGITGTAFVKTSSAAKAATRAKNNAKKGVTEGKISVPAFLDTKSDIVEADMDAAKAGDVVIVSVDCYQTQDN